MATPHVSGVAGLLWAHFPDATNAEIRDAMNATAVDLGDAGRDTSFGYGLVQAAAAYDYLANGGGGGGGGGGDPTCEADGVCDPACADGADPDCGGGECLPRNASCSSSSECCSGDCRVRRGSGSCR